jgi:hypothetical protein
MIIIKWRKKKGNNAKRKELNAAIMALAERPSMKPERYPQAPNAIKQLTRKR